MEEKEFFEKVDLVILQNNLQEFILTHLGLNLLSYIKIEKRDNDRIENRIQFETIDFGILQKPRIFKELYLGNFGGNYNEKTQLYWMPISYQWRNFSHGTNGTSWVTLWVDIKGKIVEYEFEKDKHNK